jgi:hypothetical protein
MYSKGLAERAFIFLRIKLTSDEGWNNFCQMAISLTEKHPSLSHWMAQSNVSTFYLCYLSMAFVPLLPAPRYFMRAEPLSFHLYVSFGTELSAFHLIYQSTE